jgi:DNA-directed RNA polymerase specialized sigma24 family protein
LAELYRLGATGGELAVRFGISLSSVKRLLHERSVRHAPTLTPRQAEAVFASYRAGVGPRELSRRYGVTERTIKYLLQKHGVQRQRA